MAGEKLGSPSMAMVTRISAGDRDLLLPSSSSTSSEENQQQDPEDPLKPSPSPRDQAMVRGWLSKKFMSGCVILLPIAITFYITWWFLQFVDGFFSPIYSHLGIHIFGLGFITSIAFIFMVGVFVSSWVGASILQFGERFIEGMPLVRHIYSASKQISAAISPDQTSRAFKEVAIIRHPRVGEYAFGFITSTLTLQTEGGSEDGEELCSVYVPTNHLYIGDIFLVNSKDLIRPNISVREGIEIVVSGGMTMPEFISPLENDQHP